MSDRAPRSRTTRLHLVAPLAALALVLAGTTAAFASGAFESNDSGFDSPRDIAERGSAPDGVASTTTTSSPATVDDRGVDAVAEDQSFVTVPDGTTQTFVAGDAGSVTIRRDGAALSVVTVSVNAGWVPDIEQGSGVELEVNFENGTRRVDFNAELEDGAVRVRVRVRDGAVNDDPPVVAPAPEPAPRDDNSGPGSIDDNSGPGNVDDHGGDANDDHSGDDHSGHGGDDSDGGSGHGGSGRD